MPVGTLTLELSIEGAHSLKDRRQVARSLKEQLRRGFNVSVAEMDEGLVYNRLTLACAAISASGPYVDGLLVEAEKAARRIVVGLGAEILDSYIERD